MVIAQEEIFGPVFSIITYQTEEEAISIANDTIYVWRVQTIGYWQRRLHVWIGRATGI